MELNIGERIEILRKDLSMSRRVFGEKLGVSESVIVNIEYDKLICKEFNVNEEWLRTGNGEMFIPLTRDQLITDFAADLIMEDNTFKKRLVEALAKLDESEWEVLEKLAESLIKKD